MPVHPSAPALFSAALESIPLGVLIADCNGVIVWANSLLATLTGYTAEELTGKSVTMLATAPESWLGYVLPEAISPGQPWKDECVLRRKNGVSFAGTRTFARLPDGNLLLTFQEIPAEAWQAKEASQLTEERYRLISENTVDVIWLWSLQEDRCIFVSPSVLRMRGFTPAEVMEQSMEQAITAESYQTAVPQLYACAAAVEAGDESRRIQSYELDFICRDGSTIATETVTKLLSDKNGKVQHILGVTRDITERRLAQQDLKNAEEKYRKIFDGAMEGIYRTTVDGLPLDVNPALAKMMGYDSAQGMLSSVTNVGQQLWVDPNQRVEFLRMLEERGTVRDFECRQRRKDGGIIWVSVNTRRVRGPNGENLHNEGFMEDITERKRMEDALRQSEEKFSKAFQSSPACVSIHDLRDGGRILDVNEAFEQFTGYPRAEAIGRGIDELELCVGPLGGQGIIERLLSRGKIRNLEHRLRCKNGEIRTGLLSGDQIEFDGRLCAIITDIDISERKEAEERIGSLATAIEQAGEQIVITDLNATIEYCNPAFEKTTGYSKAEVLGQNPRVLKSGKQPGSFYRDLWKTIGSGMVWTGRFTNRRKDGSLYEEESTISPIRDVTGKIKGYVAIKRDVSERIQLENQFRQAQKMESVGRLAGGVAHDFNNLLTIINGYSGLLVEQLELYDPLRPYADQISRAGERAAGLTRQLLAFSRKQVIEVKALDLNVVVRDAERMLRRLIGEDIELLTSLGRDMGKVMGDLDQLHQVIMNLVVNARDAMPDGGTLIIETKEVEIQAASTLDPDRIPGRYVMMSITDTGIGMDEQTMESIFEPFFTTKETGKGTGLGLSTVYGIVRQNDGWVEVSSRLGQGTVFRVYLPRVDPSPSETVETPAIAQAKQGGKTVLLVEDHEDVRALAKTILHKNNYRVMEARNGNEAYVLAREYSGDIHLLLTDVVMPGMNGKELSDLMKIAHPRIRVLFTSGYTADVIAHRGVLDPNMAYLAKPFSAETLAAKVREVLLD